MSTLKVEVVPVVLTKHPDADMLSIAIVKGWQCVVKTSDFEGVALGAYIPIDSVLPETPEWEFLRPRKFRVKTIKLRGALSQGLLIPAKPGWNEGDDVTEELGVKKYEPPEPVHLAGKMAKDVPGFDIYTDIENWKNYPDVFEDGEEIIITEKIHGTNFRVGIIDGKFCVGTHKTVRNAEESDDIYCEISRSFNIKDILENFVIKTDIEGKDIILYGEIYGGRIQKGFGYGEKKPSVRFFDLKVDGRFIEYDFLEMSLREMELPIVPLLYRGPYSKQVLSLASGKDFSGNHIREGIVIKPLKESLSLGLGRKILKFISDEYLLKDQSDWH